MNDKSIKILSTKKLLSNQRQFLLNADFGLIEADFIKIDFLKVEIKTSSEYLLFTSQNAVNSVISNENWMEFKRKKCFCVGKKTKALLEQNGFVVVQSFEYVEELATYLIVKHSHDSFAFFSGNLRQDTLPIALQQANITFEEKQVYRTDLTPIKVESKVDGILFFSPSGVKSYLKENTITNQVCFCIGTTTAKEVEITTKNVLIANQPTVENTIIQCINYFNQKNTNL
jgi:uroporphyrinogen-III synthase